MTPSAVEEISGVAKRTSRDGSHKYIFGMPTGLKIEAAFFHVPGRARPNIACVSTQLGCAVGCVFCSTAKSAFYRNLTKEEILCQVNTLVSDNDAQKTLADGFEVSFMGMGEPLANLRNVTGAIEEIARRYPEISRVSISTAGPARRIDALTDAMPTAIPVHLQVSLHATSDWQRNEIVPRAPSTIGDLLRAANAYHDRTGDHVCLNYVPIEGQNDSPRDAAWLSALDSRAFYVKLSRLNMVEGMPPHFQPKSREATRLFADEISAGGLEVQIFEGDGLDVNASCGQLAAAPRLIEILV